MSARDFVRNVIAVALALPLTACSPGDLTREQAAVILAKSRLPDQHAAITIRETVACVENPCQGIQMDWGTAFAFFNLGPQYIAASGSEAEGMLGGLHNPKLEAALKQLDPITSLIAEGKYKSVLWQVNRDRGTARLIPVLGDEFRQCRQADGQPYRDGYVGTCAGVVVGTFKVDQITGITGEGQMRRVEYVIKSEPNSLGVKLGIASETRAMTATFTKYDDGWRLSS